MKIDACTRCRRTALSHGLLPFAHHSFAMFDPEKLIVQTGTVKEFEWTNPHVWLHILSPDSTGKPVEWSFEMQAVAQATTGGWRVDSVKPGDRVSVEFHPLKDGSRGGELVPLRPDGNVLVLRPQDCRSRKHRKQGGRDEFQNLVPGWDCRVDRGPRFGASFLRHVRSREIGDLEWHREGIRMDQSACVDSYDGARFHGQAGRMVIRNAGHRAGYGRRLARPNSVKPGDKVSIDFHPLKDGTRGGQLVAATLADGKRLGGPVRRPGAQD
jgi:hypothetical protein